MIPNRVTELVELFREHRDVYKSANFKEAELQQQFINPFWEALGWDMSNKQGLAEAYKEVIVQDRVRIDDRIKAPDYVFRAGPEKKFFLEVKAPKVNLATDPAPAYQLKRYAWTAGLSISVLSDFEEFAVYQTTAVPKPTDKPSKDRIAFIGFAEYEEKWDWLEENFSREAIWKGRFDKYAAQVKGKRGTTPFDKAFLADMHDWRKRLAENIALRNKGLSEAELNFAVQVTLDRIIMLRICEDRKIEQYGNLALDAGLPQILGIKKERVEQASRINKERVEQTSRLLSDSRPRLSTVVYKNLLKRFAQADDRFNSGLFHFKKEKGREHFDSLTPKLTIDDKVLTDIIKHLYYPESPYAFDIVPSDILGHVYEKFLGQVITLTKSGNARVEDKPEVKKAGGVYYTPTYIVDYIVKNTVGRVLDGDRGSGSGDRVEAILTTNKLDGKDTDKKLSRSPSMADGDGYGRRGLRSPGIASQGRTLRASQPNESRGDLSPEQYRGGMGEEAHEGIHSSPLDIIRVADGNRNTSINSDAKKIPDSRANREVLGVQLPDGPNAQSPNAIPGSSRTPVPGPRTPTLKILDPACGSGSFLLGAYQYLLDWYLRFYHENNPESWAKKKVLDAIPTADPNKKEYHLSIAERKRILLEHIHGVDIDSSAVEVAKLNLMLKVLEGGHAQAGEKSAHRIAYDVTERLLPDLDKNIVCGNSLIGLDYFSQFEFETGSSARTGSGDRAPGSAKSSPRSPDPGSRTPVPGPPPSDMAERAKINAMDWRDAFPEIMKRGGFDVVIGNPPYLFITELEQGHKDYYFSHYSTTEYRFDVYGLFIERILTTKILNDGGLISFIIPHTLLANDSYTKLRTLILNKARIVEVIDIGPGVFQNARNETMVFIFEKGGRDCNTHVVSTNSKSFPTPNKEFEINQNVWKTNPNSAWEVKSDSASASLITKMELAPSRLGKYCTINQGLRTGDNEAFINEKKRGMKWEKAVGGKDVSRYGALIEHQYVDYSLEKLDAPRKREIFDSPSKIVVQEIRNIALSRRIVATYDDKQFFCLQSTNVINLRKDTQLDLLFLLGILNSTAVNFYFRQRFTSNNHIPSNQLAQVPIPTANDEYTKLIVKLVGQMLSLMRGGETTQQDRTLIDRQIAATDREIDRLVYALYGLTEEEIRIVEGET